MRAVILMLLVVASLAFAGGSVVPVGTYLYANYDKLPERPGSLVLRFTSPGPKRLVVLYGRKYRKVRKSRELWEKITKDYPNHPLAAEAVGRLK